LKTVVAKPITNQKKRLKATFGWEKTVQFQRKGHFYHDVNVIRIHKVLKVNAADIAIAVSVAVRRQLLRANGTRQQLLDKILFDFTGFLVQDRARVPQHVLGHETQ
jgi:hypothetical protein